MSLKVDEAMKIEAPTPTVRYRKVLWTAAIAAMAALLVAAFAWAPEDLEQGPPQRIFYIHVPSAWVGFLAFFVVFAASIAFLAKAERRFDRVAASSAEVGFVFTTAVLVTGPLWARPIWGVFWSWDPRLTSFLVLWLTYASYLVLRGYVPDPARRARFSAVLGIVGFLNVPVVYLSIRWWRAQHPEPVVFVRGGPRMPPEMLVTLVIGVVAFTLLYLALVSLRVRVARLEEREEIA